MRRSMFTYIFSLLLIVSLVLTLVLSALFYYNSLDLQIQNRLDELTESAEELAYMARNQRQSFLPSLEPLVISGGLPESFRDPGSDSGRRFSRIPRTVDIHEGYINWKISQIYTKYSAYTILLYTDEATGKMVSVLYSTADLSPDEITEKFDFYQENYSERLMNGETIRERTNSKKGTIFTVGIPIVMNGKVRGGVFIHTTAQVIRAGFNGFAWKTILATGIVFLLSAVCAFFLARNITNPLASIAASSRQMQHGDFTARAPVAGSSEVCFLAESFNDMAVQLQHVEQQRRDLIANVSHELRSPVTSIQGYAEGILDGTIGNEDQEKYLRIITDETHRLDKLINNLLSLSRMEKENPELTMTDFDLCELTRRILISKLNDIDKKAIEPEADIPDEPIYVSADKDAIQQVIINLLDNAVKYTGENGKIKLSLHPEKDTVIWQISDNGPGIPEEDRPFIFDRFYMVDKAHTSGKGTGLGLAICKRIMDNHKQTIRLVNGDNGCTFEFTLNRGSRSGGAHADLSQCED
ncbi:MAG: hypothetical protein CW338_09675 [Clostridiales bacterium]|nr:hypothetical protein [Clostridiales bacterium]